MDQKPQLPRLHDKVLEGMPTMIAVCTNPNGLHEHIPIASLAEAKTCFADCDCTPKVYVELAPLLEWNSGPVARSELRWPLGGEGS